MPPWRPAALRSSSTARAPEKGSAGAIPTTLRPAARPRRRSASVKAWKSAAAMLPWCQHPAAGQPGGRVREYYARFAAVRRAVRRFAVRLAVVRLAGLRLAAARLAGRRLAVARLAVRFAAVRLTGRRLAVVR